MRTVLKNGTIVDGTGTKSHLGSVILTDDRITDILSAPPAHFDGVEIDCEGSIIAPGFIDIHSHNDWFVNRDEPIAYYQPFVEQGIVTACTGNCGFAAAGFRPGADISDMTSGYKKDGRNFADLSDWFDFVDHKMPSNHAALVAHGSVRYSLVGPSTQPLTGEQLQQMRQLLRQSLASGACGVSMGLEYAPGMYAPYEELLAVAKVVKEFDAVLTLHTRGLGILSSAYEYVEGGRPHNLLALDEAIALGRDSGCSVHYSHASFSGAATFATNDEMLATIDRARADGVDITFDIYSLPSGMSFITYPMPFWFQGLPEAVRYRADNLEKLKAEFEDRARVNRYTLDLIYITNNRVRGCRGKSITQIAQMWNMDPFDAYIQLVRMTHGEQRILQKTFVDDDTVEVQSKHPACLFMTDAWFEPGCIQNYNVYGCFPHLIARSRDGYGPCLEDCIRKMTGGCADRFKLSNRGYLCAGMYADVCVFDLDDVKAHRDRRPEGFRDVFINGIRVIENGDTYPERLIGAGQAVRVSHMGSER